MAQPTATGLTLNAGSGGSDLAKVTYSALEYQWVVAGWWDEGSSVPRATSMAQPVPVQPGTSTTWAVTQSGTWSITVTDTSAALETPVSELVTSAGDTTLVSAVVGKRIRVHSLFAVNLEAPSEEIYFHNTSDGGRFGDATQGILLDLEGSAGIAQLALPHNPGGWFETGTANEALEVNNNGGKHVWISLTYSEIT